MKMDKIIRRISYYAKLVAAPFSLVILVAILTSCGKDGSGGTGSSQTNDTVYESYVDFSTSDIEVTDPDTETVEYDSSLDNATSEDGKETTDTSVETTTKPTTTPQTSTTKPTTSKQEETTKKEEETTKKPNNYDINLELPSATGVSVSNLNGYIIDYSNIDSGYVMIKAEVDAEAVVQVRLNDKKGDLAGQYVLKISNNYVAIPLTKGSATYCVRIMQKNPDTGKYAEKNAVIVTPNIANERQPFKMPNVYVYYMKTSTAVNLSYQICEGLTSDEAKVQAIYKYIVKTIDYDYNFAKVATAGYMDSERCLRDKKGICGDYSVLFATMCRAQGIPCVVIEGYVTADGQVYHAWNQVYYNKSWHFYDTTFDASGGKGKNYLESFRY